jgi:phosphate transport system substrate-binding protein
MNLTRLVGLLAISVFLVVAFHGLGETADKESSGKLIRVRGSNAMARMTDGWGKAFTAGSPGEHVTVAGGGTDAGFEALFDRTADLMMASRKAFPKEIQAAVLNDCLLKEVEVCHGAIAVITHPSNPVKELTVEQLGNIFKGEIINWKELGGPDGLITVYVGQPISGTAVFLREHVMGNDLFGSDARARDYYHHIIRDLEKRQPPGLGYAPLLDATSAQEKNQVRIMGIKKDPGAAAVYPSLATVKDKTYPLMLPLYFYWNANAASPLIDKFVEFCKKQCEIGR